MNHCELLSPLSAPRLTGLVDRDFNTPLLTAAARSKGDAFNYLMNYQESDENPIFQALESKANPINILKVATPD